MTETPTILSPMAKAGLVGALALTLALGGCGRGENRVGIPANQGGIPNQFNPRVNDDGTRRETIFDLFANADDPNVTLEVNRYLWVASLDVLNFLPIQTVDPFSGVIVTGYGTPPGGGRAYRATVLVRDPALEARSLKVSIATRSGPASAETVRAVEDAILTRARQLRIQDAGL